MQGWQKLRFISNAHRTGIWLLIWTLLLLSACEINRLNQAEEMHNRGKHALAIEELDHLIKHGKNGAYVARAELIRSDSYLSLAKTALERQDQALAIRFLKLANSTAADLELGKIYLRLSQQAYQAGNKQHALKYLHDIDREIPDSPLIPEVLLRQISIYVDEYQDRNLSWEIYKSLHDRFPNNSYEIQARKYIMQFIDSKVDYAVTLKESAYYTDALKELFELAQYPVVDTQEIRHLISDVYQAQAEEFIGDQDYIMADQMFRISMQYNPAKEREIRQRLESITSLYIQKGDSLFAERDFNGALLHYQKTFDIIPDYPLAVAAIERLEKRQRDIAQAALIFKEAERLETGQKYQEALDAYNRALALDALPEYRQKISTMQNILEAQKNPSAFAQRIINEYKGGLLLNRVAAKRQEVLQEYKANEIRDSGWKILLSTGQFKYEARYDLLTPVNTYLYVWQINLKDKSILPLNRLSEDLMK